MRTQSQNWFRFFAEFVFAASLAATPYAWAAEVGQPAPDFSLTDVKGSPVKLSDSKGKFVVLEWFNPDCPFVKKHYGSGNMQKLQADAAGQGAVWISINSSAPDKQGNYPADILAGKMQEWNSKAAAIVQDPDGTLGKAYGAKTTPHLFVINPEGVLIYAGAIDDKASPDPADIPNAKNYVRAALDEAKAGKPVSIPTSNAYGCSVKYGS